MSLGRIAGKAGSLALATLGVGLGYVALGMNYTRSHPQVDRSVESVELEEFKASLPDKLTQEGDEFYKNPHKEFRAYRQVFSRMAEDGMIDNKELTKLEVVLDRTMDEIDNKMYDGLGMIRKSFPETSEGDEYGKIVNEGRMDLKSIREHLERRENWRNNDAAKGKFVNHGSGLVYYIGLDDNNSFILNKRFSESTIYKSRAQLLAGGDGFIAPETQANSDEFPIGSRFPYALGVLLGIVAPIACGLSSIVRNDREGNKIKAGPEALVSCSLLNSIAGTIVLDSAHPFVYPVRVGIPMAYEAIRWAGLHFDKNKGKNTVASGKSAKKVKGEASQADLPTPDKMEIFDPWSVSISDGKSGGK